MKDSVFGAGGWDLVVGRLTERPGHGWGLRSHLPSRLLIPPVPPAWAGRVGSHGGGG